MPTFTQLCSHIPPDEAVLAVCAAQFHHTCCRDQAMIKLHRQAMTHV